MTSITSTAQWSTRINRVIFAVLDVLWTMGLNSNKTSKVLCINVIFHHFPRKSLLNWFFYKSWYGGMSPRRNHIFTISYQSVKGFWISHRKVWSPLTRCCTNVQLVIARISKTKKPMKIWHSVATMKIYPLMQYHDVTANSRWWTTTILKIVKMLYLSEKLSDFDEI